MFDKYLDPTSHANFDLRERVERRLLRAHMKHLEALPESLPLKSPLTSPAPTLSVEINIVTAMKNAYVGFINAKRTPIADSLLLAQENFFLGVVNKDQDLKNKAIIDFVTEVQKHEGYWFLFYKQPKASTIFFNSLSQESLQHINDLSQSQINEAKLD
jgi:hypothetical protein